MGTGGSEERTVTHIATEYGAKILVSVFDHRVPAHSANPKVLFICLKARKGTFYGKLFQDRIWANIANWRIKMIADLNPLLVMPFTHNISWPGFGIISKHAKDTYADDHVIVTASNMQNLSRS